MRTSSAPREANSLIERSSKKDGSPGGWRTWQAVDVEDDARQQVVKVVREAAGQLADRLQLLTLHDPLLEQVLFSHVDDVGGGRASLPVKRHVYVDGFLSFARQLEVDRTVERLGQLISQGCRSLFGDEEIGEAGARLRAAVRHFNQRPVGVHHHSAFDALAIQTHHAEWRIGEKCVSSARARRIARACRRRPARPAPAARRSCSAALAT